MRFASHDFTSEFTVCKLAGFASKVEFNTFRVASRVSSDS